MSARRRRGHDHDLRALAEGRRAFTPPKQDVPETPVEELLPEWARRTDPAELPEISEPEIVRHYTRSRRRTSTSTRASTRWARAR